MPLRHSIPAQPCLDGAGDQRVPRPARRRGDLHAAPHRPVGHAAQREPHDERVHAGIRDDQVRAAAEDPHGHAAARRPAERGDDVRLLARLQEVAGRAAHAQRGVPGQRHLLPGPPVGDGHGLDRRARAGRHVDVLDGQPAEGAGEGEDAVPERGARVEEDEGPAVDHAQPASAGGWRLERLDADRHPELLGDARQLGEQRGHPPPSTPPTPPRGRSVRAHSTPHLASVSARTRRRRRPPPTPAAGSGWRACRR